MFFQFKKFFERNIFLNYFSNFKKYEKINVSEKIVTKKLDTH